MVGAPGRAGSAADLRNAASQAAQKIENGEKGVAVAKVHPIMALLSKHESQIKMALPKTSMDIDRFKRIAVTTWNSNTDLQRCEPISFLAACMLAAQVGLEPGGPLGQAWLVPYKGKVQFQIGYQGYVTLMYRSGEYKSLAVHEVCEHDEFEFEYGLEEKLRHKPAIKTPRGATIGYYLVAHYKSGGHFIYWMGKGDVEHIRKFSQAPNSPMWTNHPDAAGRKTIIKQAQRWMPKSIEATREISQDGAVKDELVEDMTTAAGEYPDADFVDHGPIDGEQTRAEEAAGDGELRQTTP